MLEAAVDLDPVMLSVMKERLKKDYPALQDQEVCVLVRTTMSVMELIEDDDHHLPADQTTPEEKLLAAEIDKAAERLNLNEEIKEELQLHLVALGTTARALKDDHDAGLTEKIIREALT